MEQLSALETYALGIKTKDNKLIKKAGYLFLDNVNFYSEAYKIGKVLKDKKLMSEAVDIIAKYKQKNTAQVKKDLQKEYQDLKTNLTKFF